MIIYFLNLLFYKGLRFWLNYSLYVINKNRITWKLELNLNFL